MGSKFGLSAWSGDFTIFSHHRSHEKKLITGNEISALSKVDRLIHIRAEWRGACISAHCRLHVDANSQRIRETICDADLKTDLANRAQVVMRPICEIDFKKFCVIDWKI